MFHGGLEPFKHAM